MKKRVYKPRPFSGFKSQRARLLYNRKWRAANPDSKETKEKRGKLTRRWIKQNRERYRQSKKENRTRNFAQHLLDWARRRAKVKGLYFDLSLAWVKRNLAPGKCPVTGIIFDVDCTNTTWRRNPFRPSIDRIDSSEPYRKSNCRIVVWIFNHSKSDWTDSEVLFMARGIVANAPKD